VSWPAAPTASGRRSNAQATNQTIRTAAAVAYVRIDDEDDAIFAALLKDIAACCLREGLRLIRTFADRGYDGSQLARPGIVEMREVLKDTAGLTVVVPTLDHFSPADSIRSALTLMVHKLGGTLLVANEPNGCPNETGTTQHSIELDDTDEAGS
jgi:hypothetical protein